VRPSPPTPIFGLDGRRLGAIALRGRADLAVAKGALTTANRLAVEQGHSAPKMEADSLLRELAEATGDEDADEPITTHASYGVTALEDLSATIDGNISTESTHISG